MLRLISILCSFTIISSTSVLSIANLSAESKTKDDTNLRETILKNRVKLDDVSVTGYDNKNFYSKGDLDTYLSKKFIKQKWTSSNPSLIMKNDSIGLLDKNRIFEPLKINGDEQSSNAMEVYRDAFGNIINNRDKALNTYIKQTKLRYTPDFQHFYENKQDAKDASKQFASYTIKSTLAYNNSNGKYYNAFNDKDMKIYINGTGQESYYLQDPTDFANKKMNLFGKNSNNGVSLNDEQLYSELRPAMHDSFFTNIFSSKLRLISNEIKNFVIQVYPNGFDQAGVLLTDSNNNSLANWGWISSWQPIIRIKQIGNKREFASLEDFKEILKNNSYIDYSNTNHVVLSNVDYYCTDTYGRPYDITNGKITFGVIKNSSYSNNKSGILNHFTFDDTYTNYSVTLHTYDSKQKLNYNYGTYKLGNVQGHMYDLSGLPNNEKDKLYNAYMNNYITNTLENKEDKNFNTNTDYYENLKASLVNTSGNYFDVNNVQLKHNKLDDINKVYQDRQYNGQNSIDNDYINWQSTKKTIMDNNKAEINKEGQQTYFFDKFLYPQLVVTKDELDNFIPLTGLNNLNCVYWIGPKNNDNTSLIDFNHVISSKSEAENQLDFLNNNNIAEDYVVYDQYNNVAAESPISEEAAINKFKVNFNGSDFYKRYIPQDEYNYIHQLGGGWDSIVTDGNYCVYAIPDINNSGYLYYETQEEALAALKAGIHVTWKNSIAYVYNYRATNGQVIPILFYDNDIQSAIDKIHSFK